jgi:hypothetical protein
VPFRFAVHGFWSGVAQLWIVRSQKRYMNIPFLFFCFLATGFSASLTAVVCWVAHRRHRKAGWYLAVLAAISAGVLTVLLIFQSAVFHLASWRDSGILPCFLMTSGIGFIPGLFVVRYYRERFKREKHVF